MKKLPTWGPLFQHKRLHNAPGAGSSTSHGGSASFTLTTDSVGEGNERASDSSEYRLGSAKRAERASLMGTGSDQIKKEAATGAGTGSRAYGAMEEGTGSGGRDDDIRIRRRSTWAHHPRMDLASERSDEGTPTQAYMSVRDGTQMLDTRTGAW